MKTLTKKDAVAKMIAESNRLHDLYLDAQERGLEQKALHFKARCQGIQFCLDALLIGI